jgi:hypothetical protein
MNVGLVVEDAHQGAEGNPSAVENFASITATTASIKFEPYGIRGSQINCCAAYGLSAVYSIAACIEMSSKIRSKSM